jgi:twitching motility protein PilT
MPKIDAYLRSIERFGATGARLVSGQSITLHFPTGDRHATQVTPHELLVVMLREVAPPAAWASLESSRRARFELDSGGARFAVDVLPRPGSWQVALEVLAQAPAGGDLGAAAPRSEDDGAAAAVAALGDGAARGGAGLSERAADLATSVAIERSQYDAPSGEGDRGPAGGGVLGDQLLGQLLGWARKRGASDLIVAAGVAPVARVQGVWQPVEPQRVLDGDVLSRELGVLAPAAARAGWSERGAGTFAFSDPGGRVRVQLGRDLRGPRAALRLLDGAAASLEQLGVPDSARRWLHQPRGLVVVAGEPGSGKSTTLAALLRHLAVERRRAVVALEDPIELVHDAGALLSQRQVGEQTEAVAVGVRAAMREGAEVIAAARVATAEDVTALADAVEAGHLVLVVVEAATASAALAAILEPRGAGSERQRRAVAAGALGVLLQELRLDGANRRAVFEPVAAPDALAALAAPRAVQPSHGE